MNKNIPLPLYYQIKEEIIKRIKDEKYLPDDKIPSENELKEIYSVSSITIRKALSELVNEGYLYRVQGKGTYISKPKLKKALSTLSFTDELMKKGLKPETRLLELVKVNSGDLSNELSMPAGQEIYKIKRLRLANEEPLAIQTSYIPSSIIHQDDIMQLEKIGSLYSILKTKDIIPYKAKEIYSIQVINDREVCNLLGIKKNSPVFFVQRHTFTSDGLNFEYAESILRGDTYQLEIDVNGIDKE